MLSRWAENDRQNAWNLYIAETLRKISESTAKYAGGTYTNVKWEDIINPKPAEKRSGKEVIDSILKKLREVGN